MTANDPLIEAVRSSDKDIGIHQELDSLYREYLVLGYVLVLVCNSLSDNKPRKILPRVTLVEMLIPRGI